jgi:L-histidine Nalpha-methyltransferase
MAHLPIPAREPLPGIAEDVLRGLTAVPKTLPPRLFYDAVGSDLFEQITRLPEYYLTRTERGIFEQYADHMIATAGRGISIVELGAGTAAKTSVLLRAALRRQLSLTYYPVDVSSSALKIAQKRLSDELPRLTVEPLVTDYTQGLPQLADIRGRKLVLYIGSSIGNFEPQQAANILWSIHGSLNPGDALLLGTDLVKRSSILRAAYNDKQGVTAAFNLNMLARINRELGGDFNLRRFRHEAIWNPIASRIEMYVVSLAQQSVNIRALDLRIAFAEGERIHTENSYKFTCEMVNTILSRSGFALERTWSDAQQYFAVHLARAE